MAHTRALISGFNFKSGDCESARNMLDHRFPIYPWAVSPSLEQEGLASAHTYVTHVPARSDREKKTIPHTECALSGPFFRGGRGC